MTNPPVLLALSVQEPWSTAILDFGKDVENRDWHRSPGLLTQARRLVGRRLMLHAGKTFDDSGVPVVRALTSQRILKTDCTLGAVLGVITLQAVTVDGEATSRWAAHDAVHLHLTDPIRLTDPIPCRGALGCFCPDDTVQERVRRQLAAPGITL